MIIYTLFIFMLDGSANGTGGKLWEPQRYSSKEACEFTLNTLKTHPEFNNSIRGICIGTKDKKD